MIGSLKLPSQKKTYKGGVKLFAPYIEASFNPIDNDKMTR